jgi:predicted pyridoxine 5'-phosphate oxidase superfamily flavin-nucleotide-binding protein
MSPAHSPWHEGERRLQARAGVGERMASLGDRVLRDHMPDQHRSFFALLPYIVVARLDEEDWPRISLLTGVPGFVHSPAPRTLRIEAPPGPLMPGQPVGMLGLQAHTGRRNRMNGRVWRANPESFEVSVAQSFGNCPKYIHPREAVWVRDSDEDPVVAALDELDEGAARLVRSADTFFIATAHPLARVSSDPSQGLDVSHRGGTRGFVRMEGESLVIPDYVGNSFFNTFGNLQLEPRCELLFIDFQTGERLFIQARASVHWDDRARSVRAEVCRVLRIQGGLPLRWVEAPA